MVGSGETIIHSMGVIPAILLQLPPCTHETRHHAHFNSSPGIDAQHQVDFEARINLHIVQG